MSRYHNHAGTSWPKPPEVLAAAERATCAPPEAWPGLFEGAHQAVAGALAVAPADLLITPSCTQALAAAVADVPWRRGDRAISTSMEHHALVRPLAKLSGVEVAHVGRGAGGALALAAVERELRRGGVRLVAASMASNVTGELLPWRELIALAHRHGALCLLDGAQVAGWLELDLTAMEVDLFAFAGHKGPQGPSGVGGLYVRPGTPMDAPGYCDTGSVNLPALCGLAQGLAWMRRERPLARALSCVAALRERLAGQAGVRLLGAASGVPTCSLTAEGVTPQVLAAGLRARGTVASGGHQCAPLAHEALGNPASGALRISFGPSHTPADAHAVADQLLDVLEEARR